MKLANNFTQTGLVFFLLFLIFTVAIQARLLIQFDMQSMIFIQKYMPSFADTPLSFFSLLGSFEITTTLLCIFLWIRKRFDGLMIFGFYGAGLIIELIGKNFIYHPGPPGSYYRYDLGFSFPTSKYTTGYSYPSGHSLRSAYIIIILLALTLQSQQLSSRRKSIIVCILLLFLSIMLVSRVSLGEHWASDVLAGAALGSGLALISVTPIDSLPKSLLSLRKKIRSLLRPR